MPHEKGFFRNVLKLGGGTALGQMLVVIATPIITRLYNPHELGLLGIFMAFVGFVGVGVGFRYEMSLVSVQDDREADCLLTSSLLLTVPTSLCAGFILYIMIRNNLLSYRSLPGWSVIVAVFMLILTGVFTSLRFWCVRHSHFEMISRVLVSQGLGRAVVPIAYGLAKTDWLGLLLGEMLGRILGIGRMLRMAWPSISKSLYPFRAGYFAKVMRQNWKSPAILLPSSMIDALAAMLPLPVISFLFGMESAGQFFLVQRLSSLPAGLIATSVADVFHPSITKARWKEPDQVRAILWSVTKKLAVTSFLIYAAIAIVSPMIFGVVFGRKWIVAGICMAILSPQLMVAVVISPVSRLLLVVDRMELKLIFDLVNLIIPISSLFVMYQWGYDFLVCICAYVFSSIVANLVYYVLIWHASDVRGTVENRI
jgi:O-antigen/teichoic acid export membrane protein